MRGASPVHKGKKITKASLTNFLMHGYSNPLRKDSFIPPYIAILSLSLAIVTLALLIHLDNFLASPNSFLVPLLRHQVSVTPEGLREEGPEKEKDQSFYNLGFIKDKNDTIWNRNQMNLLCLIEAASSETIERW